MYFYNARYYDGTLGRFLSADTIVPSPANPQSLNRYAYTLNNPLRYTDPTGHFSDAQLESLGIDIDDLTPEQYALLQALEPADLIAGCNDSAECDAGYIDLGRIPGVGISLFIGKTQILEWLKQWPHIYQVRRQTPESSSRAIVWANGGPIGKWTHQAQGGWVEVHQVGWINTIIGIFMDKLGTLLDIASNLAEEMDPGGPGTMHFLFTYIDAADGTGYVREIVANPAAEGKSMIVDQSWAPILYNEHSTSSIYINDLSLLNHWSDRYYER